MLVFGSQMHIVTLVFVLLEIVMLICQLIIHVIRPYDKCRRWYLILLFLLIIYNITGGLFPDPDIRLSLVVQNIIAYGSGFAVASYFPYYFYRAFELHSIRFHALYGVPLFLIAPYLVFFVISYSISNNLDLAIRYGVIIPFFYSFIVLAAILVAIRNHYKVSNSRSAFIEEIATYSAVVPWASMTVIAYCHSGQLAEALFANLGFLVITAMFIVKSIRRARKENALLAELDLPTIDAVAIEKNCKRFGLTSREIEITLLVYQRLKHKEIADKLFISERTVHKHVENIFSKTGVANRSELIDRMNLD